MLILTKFNKLSKLNNYVKLNNLVIPNHLVDYRMINQTLTFKSTHKVQRKYWKILIQNVF